MLTVSVLIHCRATDVWSYLTTPENWSDWFREDDEIGRARGIERISPDWEQGAQIIWSSIGSKPSQITKCVADKELSFTLSAWEGVVSFILKTKGQASTQFEMRKAEFRNPGRQKSRLQEMLPQFKTCVEQEFAVA